MGTRNSELPGSGEDPISKISSDITESFLRSCSSIKPGHEDMVLVGLLHDDVASTVRKARWNSLVLNPGSTSTKVSIYSGLTLVASEELHQSAKTSDQLESRVSQILQWMQMLGIESSELNGIAARGGLMAPVQAGTYRISSSMIEDLNSSRTFHPSNLAAPMARRIGEQIGPDVLLTTTDPVMIDEIDQAYRISGSSKIRDDGTAAHYLNHRAVLKLCAGALGCPVKDMHVITCHMGGGMSAARHLGGTVVQVAQAFGCMPSANRSGSLPLRQVLSMMDERRYDLEDLRQDLTTSGGLKALAGTTDFRKLFSLARNGNGPRAKKAKLLETFFANRIAGCILELSASAKPLDAIVLTGGLAHDETFCDMISSRIHLGVPVARLPGSLEQSALAAGLVGACADSSKLLDYSTVRADVAKTRAQADAIGAIELFDENRVTGHEQPCPPESLNELIYRAYHSAPVTIALVGADNPEALLAVKHAVEQNGSCDGALARFMLLGPWGAVTQLTWELDLPIDDQTISIIDSPDPVQTSVELLQSGLVDTLMKGSVHTAHILKGYLKQAKTTATSGRRLSHIALFDIPGRDKLLAVTDAAMNTYPDVEGRIGILENALDAMKILGYRKPKVAVLSATEKPSVSVSSSVDARDIAEHFEGRQDLTIEGPMALDLAMSPDSAMEKHYRGKIQGDADLLLVPNIDAGNAVYKAFTTAAKANTAGAIIGGPRPIILTSRGDNAKSKLAAIALSVLLTSRSTKNEDRS